ncbi:hypothetical protein C8R47DRAFT_1226611 [Mycena vitilis]|nr:hypothetical protein C8R47DRAFT_1226611 [Mycena vitilis]
MASDSQAHSDDECTSDSDDTGFTSHGGSIFPGCQRFTVAGGTFTTVTNNYTRTSDVPSDFRMIPLGDIDLLREIHLNDSEANRPQRERACVKRMYSAKVDGRKSRTTVALYQGDGAEEEWRQDIAKYMSCRHPNIIQICGAATSGNIHAALFHSDLVPLSRFTARYQDSPILRVYISGCLNTQFHDVWTYILDTLPDLASRDMYLTYWFRASAGLLSVDFASSDNNPDESVSFLHAPRPSFGTILSLNSPGDVEVRVIDSLTLGMYHQLCCVLSRHRKLSYSGQSILNLGALIFCFPSKELQDVVEFASSSGLSLSPGAVYLFDTRVPIPEHKIKLVRDAWRYDSNDIFGNALHHLFYRLFYRLNDPETWLSQANHIFRDANITSGFENYAFIAGVSFDLDISTPSLDPPKGFLFLSLAEHFQVGPSSFKWPDCPAYWSLDPSGIDRLSTEDATRLGFPSIELSIRISLSSWDASIYAGLRQFHQAKGFDPDSQDVARHLGHPLYQLVNKTDAPFAYVNGAEDSESVRAEEEFEEIIQRPAAEVEEAEPHRYSEETVPTSETFKFFINARLALILFLVLLKVYEKVHT